MRRGNHLKKNIPLRPLEILICNVDLGAYLFFKTLSEYLQFKSCRPDHHQALTLVCLSLQTEIRSNN